MTTRSHHHRNHFLYGLILDSSLCSVGTVRSCRAAPPHGTASLHDGSGSAQRGERLQLFLTLPDLRGLQGARTHVPSARGAPLAVNGGSRPGERNTAATTESTERAPCSLSDRWGAETGGSTATVQRTGFPRGDGRALAARCSDSNRCLAPLPSAGGGAAEIRGDISCSLA